MAAAKKCDRCNKFYDLSSGTEDKRRSFHGSKINGIIIYTFYDKSGPKRDCDLCPKCVDDLYEFMNFEDA